MKKYISVLLLVLMTLVPFSGFAGDIDPDFQDAINLCQALGIIQNYEDGTFRPDNKVTRAEFSTILIRLLSLEQAAEAIDEPSKFNDVADNHWAKKQINLLYTLGYINGVGNGQFMPDGNVTYEQAVKTLVVILGYGVLADTSSEPWYTTYITIGAKIGLLKKTQFEISETLTRAQLAQLISNALDIELLMEK